MRIVASTIICLVMVACIGCHWVDTVTGNGHVVSEKRSASGFKEISVAGPFDVVVTPGQPYSVSIETDENLMPYINLDKQGDELEIGMLEGVNIRSKAGIKIRVSMPVVKAVSFSGSGKFSTEGVIKDIDRLDLSVAGSGDITAAVDCPTIDAEIAGSGTIILTGKCRDVKADISGSGDYKGIELQSETADISIAGSGNAWIFPSLKLDISIAGSGSIYYKGNPAIKQSIAGSGEVKKLD